RHDGPIWGFDAIESGGALVVAAGGVEDHPLDRLGGSFGYIDSFVFLYRVEGTHAERVNAINVSELRVVTPKALARRQEGDGLQLGVTGYGGDRWVDLVWQNQSSLAGIPAKETRALPPGSAFIAEAEHGWVTANPLLDAWVAFDEHGYTVVPALDPDSPRLARSTDSRLGEALFFTTLMAPWNKS